MKVLSVVHGATYGGPQNRNLHLSKVLPRRGIELTVLLPDEPGNALERYQQAGVDFVTLPLHRVRETLDPRVQLTFLATFPKEILALRSLLVRGGYDVVLINGLINPHGALAAKLQGVPVVWQLLDTRVPIFARHVMMLPVRMLADVVMSTGVAVAEQHPGATVFGERLVTFFPPVDTERFRVREGQRESARRELGLRADAKVVGCVGNINPQKGHLDFIRAAAALRARRPDLKFVLLGSTYEHFRDYADSLWAEAARLGITLGRDLIVRDPGFRVAELEPAFDVFWLTSAPRSEGIPTAIEEAMALQIPVLSFPVGSVSEAIQDGETGHVVAQGDAESLARLTLPVLDSDELARRMGQAARRVAEEKFSVDACAASHARAFELALEQRSRNLNQRGSPRTRRS